MRILQENLLVFGMSDRCVWNEFDKCGYMNTYLSSVSAQAIAASGVAWLRTPDVACTCQPNVILVYYNLFTYLRIQCRYHALRCQSRRSLAFRSNPRRRWCATIRVVSTQSPYHHQSTYPNSSTLPTLLPTLRENLNFDHRRLLAQVPTLSLVHPLNHWTIEPLNHTHPKLIIGCISYRCCGTFTIYSQTMEDQLSSALLLLSHSLSRKRPKHYRILLQLRFFLTYFLHFDNLSITYDFCSFLYLFFIIILCIKLILCCFLNVSFLVWLCRGSQPGARWRGRGWWGRCGGFVSQGAARAS